MNIRNRIVLSTATAAVLLSGSLGAVPRSLAPSLQPANALAACSLTLSASTTSARLGASVTLTATYGCAVPSGYFIDILDSTGTDWVSCTTTPCSGPVTGPASAQSTTFTAYVDNNYPPSGVIATSTAVTVSWSAPACCSVSLSANTTSPSASNPLVLTATASPSLPFDYEIDILEDGGWVDTCYSSSCTYSPPSQPGTHSYVAQLNTYDYPPYPATLATSATVRVTWLYPSQSCLSPTIPALGGTDLGVQWSISVQATSNPALVCFRVNAGPGAVLGGAVEVTPGHVPSLPTLSPGRASDCWTTATPPNQLPLHHPWVQNFVGSDEVSVDAYSDGQQVWACVQVTNGGSAIVDQKITLFTNVGVPDATVALDPDSV